MTQNARLLNYLETHPNGITTLEAMQHLKVLRLSERIRELSKYYEFSHTPEHTENARVIRYRLTGESRELPASRVKTGNSLPVNYVTAHSNVVSSPPNSYKSWMR